jgi:hypothetical protein
MRAKCGGRPPTFTILREEDEADNTGTWVTGSCLCP